MTTKAIEAGARADLLPCPFCSSADVVYCDQGDDDFAVTCKSCGASSTFDDIEANAIAAWNRRAAIASGELVPASNRERIAELLDELLPCLTRRGFTGGLATAHKELCELLGIDGGNDWREHRAKNHQPELVPASAVAAERERATALAEAINKLSRVYWSGPDVDHRAVS